MSDYALGSTIRRKFSTSVGGLGTTLAGSPAVAAYVDGSTTEITAGITLTVDFDGRTGLHQIEIVASAGNGYAAGSDYALVLTAGTVGGISVVGTVVEEFSLDRSPAATQASVDAVAVQLVDILSLVEAITVTGAAAYQGADSYTLTTGSLSSGTVADTETPNAVYHVHTDTAGALEVIYDYEMGAAEIAVEVLFRGRVNSGNDSVNVQAWDWIGADWETLWVQTGVGGTVDTNRAEPLLAKHTGTGADDGKVRIRFYAASGLSSATVYVDQLVVAKTVTAVDLLPAAVAEVQAGLATAANLATVAGYIDTEVAAIKAKTDNLPAAPAAVGDIPSVATIADAVWDEATAGHATVGSTGAALAAAGGAGDPWATVVPGAYVDGTAGALFAKLDVGEPDETVVVVPGAPADVDMCRVYGYLETLDNVPAANVEITFELIQATVGVLMSNKLISGRQIVVTTDANGRVANSDGDPWVDLQRNDILVPSGTSYRVTCESLRLRQKKITLTSATFDLASVVPA